MNSRLAQVSLQHRTWNESRTDNQWLADVNWQPVEQGAVVWHQRNRYPVVKLARQFRQLKQNHYRTGYGESNTQGLLRKSCWDSRTTRWKRSSWGLTDAPEKQSVDIEQENWGKQEANKMAQPSQRRSLGLNGGYANARRKRRGARNTNRLRKGLRSKSTTLNLNVNRLLTLSSMRLKQSDQLPAVDDVFAIWENLSQTKKCASCS